MKKPKTNAQKRVAICRDVVKQLDARKIAATSGIYFYSTTGFQVNQETLSRTAAPVCRVCALGAMFLSRVRVFDKFDGMSHWIGSSDVKGSLERIFGKRRMDAIEQAFEGDLLRCPRFNKLVDSTRLRFIAKFIIRSRGEFKPAAFEKAAERFAK